MGLAAGNKAESHLDMPAKDYLNCALTVFLGQLYKHRIVDEVGVAVTEREPCLKLDALFLTIIFNFFCG